MLMMYLRPNQYQSAEMYYQQKVNSQSILSVVRDTLHSILWAFDKNTWSYLYMYFMQRKDNTIIFI